MSSFLPVPIALGFILNTIAFTGAVVFYAKRLRRGRPPRGEDEKLLRGPGEHLQEQLMELDQQMTEQWFLGIVIPVFILLIPLTLLPQMRGRESTVMILACAGFVVSFVLRLRRVRGIFKQTAQYRLGLLGERAVAAALQPLLARGYHVFHDMPAHGAQKAFNLDHVVVGPSGLFVVETKARRKIHQDASGADHVVQFDGRSLHWPRSESREEVEQAERNAVWLRDFVHKRLGLAVQVVPLLVIPGWYVKRTGTGAVIPMNEKQVEKAILGRTVLDEKTVDQIKRQLDTECRTVSFGS
ncbi:nuclease-related domain-containing protein [Prosthecobacter sp.]|uniref:nuclease-related domain-containing protein n=1 Tax=Prosthecobacter sp. TaxID=1965333 RepID=UPI003783CCC5